MRRKQSRQRIYDKYNGRCTYCGCKLDKKKWEADHITSKYHHKYYKLEWDIDREDNLTPACKPCNFYKGEMTVEQFRERISTLHERLFKPFIQRFALKYGILEVKEWDGKFYFEKI